MILRPHVGPFFFFIMQWCHARITQWTDEVIRVASPDGDTYCMTLNKDVGILFYFILVFYYKELQREDI